MQQVLSPRQNLKRGAGWGRILHAMERLSEGKAIYHLLGSYKTNSSGLPPYPAPVAQSVRASYL